MLFGETQMAEPEAAEDFLYTRQHIWVSVQGDVATIGVTNRLQDELDDVVFVELPDTGSEIRADSELCAIESLRRLWLQVFAPVSGRIIRVNESLREDLGVINADPYGDGWIVKIVLSDPSETAELLTSKEYGHLVDEGE